VKTRRYASAITLVLIVLLIGWVAFRLTHPVSTATLQIYCTQFPTDDTALDQWLASRPLLIQSSVTRSSDTLTVKYKMQGREAGDFASNVLDEGKQMGYQVKGYSLFSNSNPFQ
jgi:predicted PurR-regulated permease PerM